MGTQLMVRRVGDDKSKLIIDDVSHCKFIASPTKSRVLTVIAPGAQR